MKFFKASVFFLLLFHYSPGQTFNYTHYTVENGLANSNVYMAFQDSKGYIWFCTEEGVNRFDGKNFTTYTIEEGLADNDVLRIIEDKNDRVWFLSFNGHLSYFSLVDNKVHNEKTDPFLKKTYSGAGFFNAFVDSKKRIWFCSLEGKISVLDSGRVKKINIKDEKPFLGEVCVSEGSNGDIFVFCSIHKYKFEESGWSLRKLDELIPGSMTTYFTALSGDIYYSSKNEIVSIKKGIASVLLNFSDSSPFYQELVTVNEDNQNLFISTRHNGVIVMDLKKSETNKFLKYPLSKQINSVTIDNEKNIWFLTRGDGVYMLPYRLRNAPVYPPEYFDNNNIFSIIAADDNTLWIGGDNTKIFRFHNGNIKKYLLPVINKQALGRIVDFEKDKSNNIWASTDGGLFKISTEVIDDLTEPGNMLTDTVGFRVLNISFNSGNKAIYSTPSFLGRITEHNDKSFKYEMPVHDQTENKRTYFAFYDMADRLFIANINGLNEMVKDSLIEYGKNNLLLRSRIICIRQTMDSTLVLATDGNGLIFFKNGNVINHITTREGLASGICRKIIINGENIFACTNRGLTSLRYISNRISGITTYTVLNGLASNDVRDVAVLQGMLYVVTSKGLSVINRISLYDAQSPPPLYINSVRDSRDRMLPDSSIVISYRNNFLKVKFKAITFSNPSGLSYQYTLDAKNENWNTTFSDEVVFSDMTPGNYTFSLRAKKVNSTWSEVIGFSFTVKPPFYMTWWFISLILIGGVVCLSLLFIYLNRRRQRSLFLQLEKRNALNLERHRISADMHDDIGSDLSKIAVTAELIKVHFDSDGNLHNQAKKINEHASNARKKMDDIIWALNPSNDNLSDLIGYVNRYCLNYFDGTPIKAHVEDKVQMNYLELNARQRRNIFLVVKEISTNTLKHSEASDFSVRFSLVDSNLLIEASDDGKGFNPEMILSTTNGLKNIKKRIADIGGSMELFAGKGEGVRYRFTIPV